MDDANIYVLTSLSIDAIGNVISTNVAVTFDIHEAEAHRGKGFENDFQKFSVPANWRDDAETSNLVTAMRAFRDYVEELRAEALR
jgi:hypothetical protein